MASDDKPSGTLERTDVIARTRTLDGKYRLGRLLGEGGMGAVYEAEHEGLKAKVAVKLLSEHGSLDAKSVARFKREARAMGAVRHENVVSVMDTGADEDGIPFLVMELLDGESLAAMLRRERLLTPGLSCWVVSQVLAGLGAAHAQGIVHRDLKPGNVFVARLQDGTHKVKILDFGISKLGGDSQTLNVTAEGALVGTPNFMAPEQITGESVPDARADIYAVGVLLYRMVSGRLPYVGKTPDELYRKVLSGQVSPPRRRNPDIPQELENVILKAMSLDRAARYQDTASFRAALHEIAPTLPGELPPTTESPQPHHLPTPSPVTARTGPSHQSNPSHDPTMAAHPQAIRQQSHLSGSMMVPSTGVADRGRRLWLFGVGGGLVVAAGVLAILWASMRHTGGAPVRHGPVLRYGIAQYSQPDEVRAAHQPIVDYLSERLDRPVELVIADDDKDLVQRFFDGEINIAALSPYAYVRAARRGTPGLILLAKPETSGGPSYQGLILTRADSKIRSLKDLEGKTFCYVGRGSTSGYLYPRALLRQAGLDPDKSFTKSFGNDHLNTLRLLDRGECQGAAVYAKILEEGDKHGMPSERFHQLAATERIPYDAYSMLAKTPPEEVAAIQGALLALEPNSDIAKKVFATRKGEIIGFTRALDSDYDPVRRIEQYVDTADTAPQ